MSGTGEYPVPLFAGRSNIVYLHHKPLAMTNVELMQSSREALKGKWGLAIATFLVWNIMMSSGSWIHPAGGLITLIIGGPLSLGASIFSLALARGQEARFEQLFDGFMHFQQTFITYLLMMVYIILWTLLLIIPGIIAALSYSMTFFILADNRSLLPSEALAASRTMMNGHKLKLFYLGLRFFLLALLCLLTLGIGFLWLIPYIQVTTARFYDDIREEKQEFV